MIVRKQAVVLARAAFTLMEMLVVVAILVVLAGAAVPIYLNYLDRAKMDRVKTDFKVLETAVQSYYINTGQFPQNLRQLTVTDQQAGVKALLEQASIFDPWQHEYQLTGQFHPVSQKPQIMSPGPPGGPPMYSWTQ
jgi:general secretion pathway protein G